MKKPNHLSNSICAAFEVDAETLVEFQDRFCGSSFSRDGGQIIVELDQDYAKEMLTKYFGSIIVETAKQEGANKVELFE